MSSISIQIYRVLLWLYPTQFRRDYGSLLLLAFEEACLDAQAQKSLHSWVTLWWKVLLDLAVSLYREHKANIMTQKIDQYEINATLGEGSAATLYRAYDPERASQVALKVFRDDSSTTLSSHNKREGSVHPVLEHPHIPRCYTYKETDNSTYLVMQYIEGKTLLEMLQARNQPFSTQQVVTWSILVCDVLAYLHRSGYIYRDMKPGNLMLSSDDTLYVIDYGITVQSEGDGVAIGTIGYAPPEQYEGNCLPQSDIYALGATMHHLLTNRDPRYHEAHSFDEALPGAYNPTVTSALEAVIMKALAVEPDGRYSTATAMKHDLTSIING